jgi:hypothetical protein
MITRRLFSLGLLAGPAIIRPGLLMPVKVPIRTQVSAAEMDALLERVRVEMAIAFQIPQRYLFGTIGVGDHVTGLGLLPGTRIVSVGSA